MGEEISFKNRTLPVGEIVSIGMAEVIGDHDEETEGVMCQRGLYYTNKSQVLQGYAPGGANVRVMNFATDFPEGWLPDGEDIVDQTSNNVSLVFWHAGQFILIHNDSRIFTYENAEDPSPSDTGKKLPGIPKRGIGNEFGVAVVTQDDQLYLFQGSSSPKKASPPFDVKRAFIITANEFLTFWVNGSNYTYLYTNGRDKDVFACTKKKSGKWWQMYDIPLEESLMIIIWVNGVEIHIYPPATPLKAIIRYMPYVWKDDLFKGWVAVYLQNHTSHKCYKNYLHKYEHQFKSSMDSGLQDTVWDEVELPTGGEKKILKMVHTNSSIKASIMEKLPGATVMELASTDDFPLKTRGRIWQFSKNPEDFFFFQYLAVEANQTTGPLIYRAANWTQNEYVHEAKYPDRFTQMATDGYKLFYVMNNSDFYYSAFNLTPVLLDKKVRVVMYHDNKFHFIMNSPNCNNTIYTVDSVELIDQEPTEEEEASDTPRYGGILHYSLSPLNATVKGYVCDMVAGMGGYKINDTKSGDYHLRHCDFRQSFIGYKRSGTVSPGGNAYRVHDGSNYVKNDESRSIASSAGSGSGATDLVYNKTSGPEYIIYATNSSLIRSGGGDEVVLSTFSNPEQEFRAGWVKGEEDNHFYFYPIWRPQHVTSKFVAISKLTESNINFVDMQFPENVGVISAASNGTWTYFVVAGGYVFLSTDIYNAAKNISEQFPQDDEGVMLPVRQVAYSINIFLFLLQDNITFVKLYDPFWHLEPKCEVEFTGPDMVFYSSKNVAILSWDMLTIANTMRLGITKADGLPDYQNEFVAAFTGGVGGFLFVTNMSTIWVQWAAQLPGGSIETVISQRLNLTEGGFRLQHNISAIEMNVVPIFYMTDYSVYIYNMPFFAPGEIRYIPTQLYPPGGFCTESTGGNYRKLVYETEEEGQPKIVHYIKRYIPYPVQKVTEYAPLESYFLDGQTNKVYKCNVLGHILNEPEQKEGVLDMVQDFYANNGEYISVSLNQVQFSDDVLAESQNIFKVQSSANDANAWLLGPDGMDNLRRVPSQPPPNRANEPYLRVIPAAGNLAYKFVPIPLGGIPNSANLKSIATDGTITWFVDATGALWKSSKIQDPPTSIGNQNGRAVLCTIDKYDRAVIEQDPTMTPNSICLLITEDHCIKVLPGLADITEQLFTHTPDELETPTPSEEEEETEPIPDELLEIDPTNIEITAFAGGVGGFFIVAKTAMVWIKDSTLSNVELMRYRCADMVPSFIQSVDMNVLPVVYLINGSTVAYSNLEFEEQTINYGCVGLPVDGCKWRKHVAHNVSRFMPYADVRNLGPDSASQLYRSHFLANNTMYECNGNQYAFQSLDYPNAYQDIYTQYFYAMSNGTMLNMTRGTMFVNYTMWLQRLEHTFIWTNDPATSANISLMYRLITAGEVPFTWIAAPKTMNIPTSNEPAVITEQIAGFRPEVAPDVNSHFINHDVMVNSHGEKVKIISAATNGSYVMYVSLENDAYIIKDYGSESEPFLFESYKGKIRQVVYANGSFHMLHTNGRTILQLDQTGTVIDVTGQFGFAPSEFIIHFVAGHGGFLSVTNQTTHWSRYVERRKRYVTDKIDITLGGFDFSEIHRIDLSNIPIFYLKNGSTITYGMVNDVPVGCSRPEVNGFRLLTQNNVIRFLPSFNTDNTGKSFSGYLKSTGRFYECDSKTELGTPSTRYTDYYEDIYIAGSHYWYMNATHVTYNLPLIYGEIDKAGRQYRFQACTEDTTTWMLIPKTMNVVQFPPGSAINTSLVTFKLRNSLAPEQLVGITTPFATYTSATTNGSTTYYVMEQEGTLYMAKSLTATPQPVVGAGFRYVLYTSNSFVFIKSDNTFYINSTSVDRSALFGLDPAEVIMNVASGLGGLVVQTNVDVYHFNFTDYENDNTMGIKKTPLNIKDEGISWEGIKRLDMTRVPIIYMKNGTVFIPAWKISNKDLSTVFVNGGSNDLGFHCVEKISSRFYKLVLDQNVERFIPFANMTSGAVVSMVLQNGKLLECSAEQPQPIRSKFFTETYIDVLVSNDTYLAQTKKSSGDVLNFVDVNSPVGAGQSFKFFAGSMDNRTWFGCSAPINGYGSIEATTINSTVMQLSDFTNQFIPVHTPPGEFVSTSTDGNMTVFVTDKGDAYYVQEQGGRYQKIYSDEPMLFDGSSQVGDYFYLNSEDKIYQFVPPGTLTEVDLGLQTDEHVVQFDSGVQGNTQYGPSVGLLLSDEGLYTIDENFEPRRLDTGIPSYRIERVLYQQTGQIFLKNGSVFITEVLNTGCLKAAKDGLQELTELWVDKYIPYGPGGKSYFLKNQTVYECNGETGIPSLEYTDKYMDFVAIGSTVATLTKDTLKVNSPQNVVNVQYEYLINPSGLLLVKKDFAAPARSATEETTFKPNSAMIIKQSYLYEEQGVKIMLPPNTLYTATDGKQLLSVTQEKQLWIAPSVSATPYICEDVRFAQTKMVGYHEKFWIVTEQNKTYSYYANKFTEENLPGISGVPLQMSSNAGRTMLLTTAGVFVAGDCHAGNCGGAAPADGYFAKIDLPFSAEQVVHVEAEQYGVVIYRKDGTVYASGLDENQYCGNASSGPLKLVGITRPVRFMPDQYDAASLTVMENADLKFCAMQLGPQDVPGDTHSYMDKVTGGAIINGSAVTGNISYSVGSQYRFQYSAFAIAAPMNYAYENPVKNRKDKSALKLGLALGFAGLALIVVLVLVIVYIYKRSGAKKKVDNYAKFGSGLEKKGGFDRMREAEKTSGKSRAKPVEVQAEKRKPKPTAVIDKSPISSAAFLE